MSYNNRQSIEKFYSAAQSRDFHRDFLFRVSQINIPGPAGDIGFGDGELVYVKTAELPARSITNVPTPYMGLEFNIPGNATYPGSDAYALKFYLDAGSELREKLELASRSVFNDQYSTGQYNTPTTDHYIDLMQLNKNLEPIGTYRLIGASIREISPVSYDMAGGNGGTVEMDVTMSYHYYVTENPGTSVAAGFAGNRAAAVESPLGPVGAFNAQSDAATI